MIKEKLMKALKTAAADYNGGMSANDAVAGAAEAWDFNEKQAERLTEMFNTLAVLNKEKDPEDPTGSCELACKEAVAKILMDGCEHQKKASVLEKDYSFYSTIPSKSNSMIESRELGMKSIVKAASADPVEIPRELNVSQRSLYKIIEGKIDLLKSASSAADDVARNLKLEIERCSIKVAKAIEDPFADPEMADMFKAACHSDNAVKNIAEYSTKVAESDGGRFARMNVFDSSKVDDLVKLAEYIEDCMSSISEYEKKRDFYMSKAAEAESEIAETVGLNPYGKEKDAGLAGMFHGIPKEANAGHSDSNDIDASAEGAISDAKMCTKIAELIRETGVSAEDVARLAEDFSKAGSVTTAFAVPIPTVSEAHSALSASSAIDDEKKLMMNVRRSVLLADLMANDPIIRDADPNIVAEAYKTMIMTSPRVSLDKAQARAFLRNAVNSVAISPADAKVLGEVDKWTSLSNIDKLTNLDSSIKDSNK